jgi:hypothetical protein
MRFPWSRTTPAEDPSVRARREIAAGHLRDVSQPSAAALVILRRHHPGLPAAEAALARREERQRQAVDDAAAAERRAHELCSGVASGRTTSQAAEAAIVASKVAALALDGFAEAVADARTKVLLETVVSIEESARSLKARRAAVEQRIAPLRRTLEAAALELATIENEGFALLTASGSTLLLGLDDGERVTWPMCPRDAAALQEWMRARPLGLAPLHPPAAPAPKAGAA